MSRVDHFEVFEAMSIEVDHCISEEVLKGVNTEDERFELIDGRIQVRSMIAKCFFDVGERLSTVMRCFSC